MVPKILGAAGVLFSFFLWVGFIIMALERRFYHRGWVDSISWLGVRGVWLIKRQKLFLAGLGCRNKGKRRQHTTKGPIMAGVFYKGCWFLSFMVLA